MATGKYLSLEEARMKGQIDRFVKAHPSAGNQQLFDIALQKMAPTAPVKVQQKEDWPQPDKRSGQK